MSCNHKYTHTHNGLIQRKQYLSSGFDFVVSISTGVAGEATCIVIQDHNLYPDNDSRSERNPERIIPLDDTEDLKKIQKLIKSCLKERKKTLINDRP